MEQKKRDKIAWVLAIVLTPVLLYLMYTNIFATQRRARPPAQPAPAPALVKSPATLASSAAATNLPAPRAPRPPLDPQTIADQKAMAAKEPARNPFAPPGQAAGRGMPAGAGQTFNFKVTAVMAAPGSGTRMAMINGKMLAPGDRIGEWTILQIDPRAVIFDNGTQRMTVNIQ